jgi:hypothetical protein
VDLGAVGQRRREVLVAVEDVGLVDDVAVYDQARLVEDDLRASKSSSISWPACVVP